MLRRLIATLQLVADVLRLVIWALEETQDGQVLDDIRTLAKTWLRDAQGITTGSALSSWKVLFADPFQPTRALLAKLQSKYGPH